MHEARRYTLEAIGVLAQLMQTAKSESVRLNAAEAILSRLGQIGSSVPDR